MLFQRQSKVQRCGPEAQHLLPRPQSRKETKEHEVILFRQARLLDRRESRRRRRPNLQRQGSSRRVNFLYVPRLSLPRRPKEKV